MRTLTLLVVLASCISFSAHASPKHGIAMHGDLKYPENFSHFDYVNPQAKKGGTLKQSVLGDNFDSFNPFIVKGVSAAGVGYLYQTLTTQSEDEAFSEYGLIAEKIDIPADRSAVTYHLNPNAKFSDGTNITTADIEYSFNALTTNEKARPFYSAYYADVQNVEVIDQHTIKFSFRNGDNKELPLILGQMPILSKKFWSQHDFSTASLTIPVSNGPYKISSFEPGRSITYTRDDNYWAKDLAVNKGRYNFDTLVFEYYKDNTIALEAFKAGEYDFRVERTARNWANAYTGSKFDDGTLIKEEVKHERPTGMQAFVLNSRRKKLSDPRVREALSFAFDFEWTNKNLFNGQYSRAGSYFENSELASSGLPSDEELTLLTAYKSTLPATVFTESYTPPTTNKPNSLRKNLRHATSLLKQAGWSIKNKQLSHNSDNEVLTLEFLLYQKDFERIVQPLIKNLEKLGIQANIRVVDTTQYINRLREFDFDIVVAGFPQSNSPGNEQREYWHSSKAAQPGSRNLAGIQDPVVDALIDKVIAAPNRNALIQRTRALDRVLLAGHYVIPNWFNPTDRIAYRHTLMRPTITPKSGVSIDTWWMK